MTGWLPKEVLDHLEHAGYVAIPKERVVDLWVEQQVDIMTLSMLRAEGPSFPDYLKRDLAYGIGKEALKLGYVACETTTIHKDNRLLTRANLVVLKPRMIT